MPDKFTGKAAQLTGIKELDRTLKQLATRKARKIARDSVLAGARAGAKVTKKSAPVGTTKRLKKSIGSAFKKGRDTDGLSVAKWGVNVGKKRSSKDRVLYGAAAVVGSKERHHKSGKSVGRSPGSDFMKNSAAAAINAAFAKIAESVKKGIAKLRK